MERRTQELISVYGALAGMVIVLMLPPCVIIAGSLWTGTSLSSVLLEAESRGMLVLYCAIALTVNMPLMIVLGLFADAVKQSTSTTVCMLYILALVTMGFSGVYYIKWFIGFPVVKYVPAILYLLGFAPVLLLGVLGKCQKHKPA